jgi:hypothetical protein
VTRLWAGWLGFVSRQGQGIYFLFASASRLALGSAPPRVQWIPGTPSPRVKRPGREADHSPPSDAEVKNTWSCTSTHPYKNIKWKRLRYFEMMQWLIKESGQLTSPRESMYTWHLLLGAREAQSMQWLVYGLDDWLSIPGRGRDLFLRHRSGPHQTPYPLSTGIFTEGWSTRSDHSPPSSAEVKNVWRYTYTSPYVFTTASRTALGFTQPPIQWVLGALSLGVKRPGNEADHSLPSSAEVKECVELYLHPTTPSWHGSRLEKIHRDNFTFTFMYSWRGA